MCDEQTGRVDPGSRKLSGDVFPGHGGIHAC